MQSLEGWYMFNCFNFFLAFQTLNVYSSDPKEFITELIGDAIASYLIKIFLDEKETLFEELAIDNVNIQALGLYIWRIEKII